jgi:hypothetical protein
LDAVRSLGSVLCVTNLQQTVMSTKYDASAWLTLAVVFARCDAVFTEVCCPGLLT